MITKKTVSGILLILLQCAMISSISIVKATFEAFSKSHTPIQSEFHFGDTINFTIELIVLQNSGLPLSISNLTVTDPLPVGETFIIGTNTSTPSSSFTAYPNGTLFWNFGPGPFQTDPQAVVSYNITVNAGANGRIYNRAAAAYTETVSGARSVPHVTDSIWVPQPQRRLTVSSPHDSPSPSNGDNYFSDGSSVTCSVTSPVTEGSTVWTCTGWTGTGSVPSTGSANSVTFMITQDSGITWNWSALQWATVAMIDDRNDAGIQTANFTVFDAAHLNWTANGMINITLYSDPDYDHPIQSWNFSASIGSVTFVPQTPGLYEADCRGFGAGTEIIVAAATFFVGRASYAVRIRSGNGGSVSYSCSNGSGVVLSGVSQTVNVAEGDNITLTSLQDSDYAFSGWSGTLLNGTPPTVSVVVEGPGEIMANFQRTCTHWWIWAIIIIVAVGGIIACALLLRKKKERALVVYDSVYGNTEKIAKALAAGLDSGGVEVDVVKVDAVNFDELDKVDLLCIGSPVHSSDASKSMKEFLERLKSVEGLTGKKAFAFDTKMSKSRSAGGAGEKIERKLKDSGLTIAKPSESAIVKGREGPLEESAEETFKQIGVELAHML